MKQLEISDAITLWKTFAKTAHFNDTEYDANLEESIRASLRLSRKETVAEQLRKKNVSVEQLLYAILNATEPFSAMLNDLLKMFECASAQSSSTNLQIKFDFDKNRKPFSFDLDHFRRTVDVTSQRLSQKHIRILQDLSPQDLWSLIKMFRTGISTLVAPTIRSPQISQWLKEYFGDEKWPDFWPTVPKTRISELDQITKKIWEMIQSNIRYYQHCDSGRQVDTDKLVGKLVEAMTQKLEGLQELKKKERSEKAMALAQKLQAIFSSLTTHSEEVMEMAECLEDILNLPYWERRYELYSAWILTQITKGLQDTGIRYHVTDNALLFSFRKTLLATCEKLKPTLQIWIELRTESSIFPNRKERKKHIQPDYTLAIDDAMNPENTVAVVECKQYKRSNGNNFFAAIHDYAAGRPKGSVFLVNYGPVSEKLLNKATSELKERAFPYGYVRPNGENAAAFRKKLKDVIYSYYQIRAVKDSRFLYPWTDTDAPCTIELKYDACPEELESWLWLRERDGARKKLWLSCLGQPDKESLVDLDRGRRNGFRQETIKIQCWLDAEYDVAIINLSGETVVEGDVEIHISCGQDCYSLSYKKTWNCPIVWPVIHLNSFGFIWFSGNPSVHLR